MKIAVFDTEGEKVEYLANLLSQDVELTFAQVMASQSELEQVGFYN